MFTVEDLNRYQLADIREALGVARLDDADPADLAFAVYWQCHKANGQPDLTFAEVSELPTRVILADVGPDAVDPK